MCVCLCARAACVCSSRNIARRLCFFFRRRTGSKRTNIETEGLEKAIHTHTNNIRVITDGHISGIQNLEHTTKLFYQLSQNYFESM